MYWTFFFRNKAFLTPSCGDFRYRRQLLPFIERVNLYISQQIFSSHIFTDVTCLETLWFVIHCRSSLTLIQTLTSTSIIKRMYFSCISYLVNSGKNNWEVNLAFWKLGKIKASSCCDFQRLQGDFYFEKKREGNPPPPDLEVQLACFQSSNSRSGSCVREAGGQRSGSASCWVSLETLGHACFDKVWAKTGSF